MLSSNTTAVGRHKSLTTMFSDAPTGLAETAGPGDVILSILSGGLDAVINVTIFTTTSARWHEVRMRVLKTHSLGMCANNLSDSLHVSISHS
jgi:hypothetical protein